MTDLGFSEISSKSLAIKVDLILSIVKCTMLFRTTVVLGVFNVDQDSVSGLVALLKPLLEMLKPFLQPLISIL